MASLILGAVGAFFFGPIGFLVGSLIGNLLFPGPGQEGPRLGSLRLQGSSYGQMIPIIWGTVRIAGQVVWQTDLVEHKHTSGGKGGPRLAGPPPGFKRIVRASSGGKGGPSVTTYTYTASFAVKLCKGEVGGVSRLWFNSEIVYDTSGNTGVDNSLVPVTIYVGRESDLPDPTMEADLGVGNVPAFRDDCTLVFTDLELGQYGNTLPQINAEVFSISGGIPRRISSFTPYNTKFVAGPFGVGPQDGAFENGELIISNYSYSGGTVFFELRHFDINGTLLSTDGPSICPAVPSAVTPPGSTTLFPCINNPHACWARVEQTGVATNAGWYYDDSLVVTNMDYFQLYSRPTYWNDAIYAVGGGVTGGITKWSAPGGVPTNIGFVTYDFPAYPGNEWQACVDTETGDVYATRGHKGSPIGDQLFHFDADLNLIESWDQTEVPSDFTGQSLVVWNGIACFQSGDSRNAVAYFMRPPGTAWVQADPGTIDTTAFGNQISLGNGLVLVEDGIISLAPIGGPVTLATIVGDISEMAGLSASDYDVSQLTDLVDGYLVTTQAECRRDIEPLRSGYYFDAVESQDAAGAAVVKFVKRGGQTIVSIPDADLSAMPSGKADKVPRLIDVRRVQEVDLPAAVNVTYINGGAAYQNGTQQARRQVAHSQAVSSVELPIVMSDQKGRQIAGVLLFGTWMERLEFKIRTTRKYAHYEPTDVFEAAGYTFRVEKKREIAGGLIEWEGLQTSPGIYTAGPSANATTGSGTVPVARGPQRTNALLLDIPLIIDTDDANGFYAAMAGARDDTWRGATLYQSRDSGTTYFSVETDTVADVIGQSSDSLGDFFGGNVFDEINSVTVVIGNGGGELSSATADAVLNGANPALLGDEILQFKNATLVAADTYTLSGLLRGRQGTEAGMSTHAIGDRFVLLPTNDVARPFADLTAPMLYKPVTIGGNLASTASQPFTNMGARLRCYSPVQLGGGKDDTGAFVLQWNRRTRIGGLWLNFVDALLSETTEAYYVYIYSDGTFATLLRTVPVTSPTFTYDTSLQATDFGSPQPSVLHWGVAQIGTLGPGTEARQST